MLRLNHTYDHLDAMSVRMDDEFKTIENVIITIFEILDKYDELIQISKQDLKN